MQKKRDFDEFQVDIQDDSVSPTRVSQPKRQKRTSTDPGLLNKLSSLWNSLWGRQPDEEVSDDQPEPNLEDLLQKTKAKGLSREEYEKYSKLLQEAAGIDDPPPVAAQIPKYVTEAPRRERVVDSPKQLKRYPVEEEEPEFTSLKRRLHSPEIHV